VAVDRWGRDFFEKTPLYLPHGFSRPRIAAVRYGFIIPKFVMSNEILMAVIGKTDCRILKTIIL
jgi:hypothetical protein